MIYKLIPLSEVQGLQSLNKADMLVVHDGSLTAIFKVYGDCASLYLYGYLLDADCETDCAYTYDKIFVFVDALGDIVPSSTEVYRLLLAHVKDGVSDIGTDISSIAWLQQLDSIAVDYLNGDVTEVLSEKQIDGVVALIRSKLMFMNGVIDFKTYDASLDNAMPHCVLCGKIGDCSGGCEIEDADDYCEGCRKLGTIYCPGTANGCFET